MATEKANENEDIKVRNPDEEYWKKRSEKKVDRRFKELKDVEKKLAEMYRSTIDTIRQLVVDMLTRYGILTDTMTYQEAIKKLTPMELADLKARMEQLRPQIQSTNDEKVIAEFEKLRTATEMTRLGAVQTQIEANLLLLGSTTVTLLADSLSKAFTDTYYESIYDLFVGYGIGFDFKHPNKEAIDFAIHYPWSNDDFSSRIWSNRDKLVTELRQTLVNGLIRGEGNQKMARQLAQKMDSNYKNALRVMRTETSFVIGEGTNQAYKQNGFVRQYIVVATPSDRTCEICMNMDGKIFNVDDRVAGKNSHPFHPNCRCADRPYIKDEDLSQIPRFARVNGKTFSIPASMSMQEFKDKYLRNGVPS